MNRKRDKLHTKIEKVGTVSSILEPISEDKDEVLKSYSRLNFKDHPNGIGLMINNNEDSSPNLAEQRSISQTANINVSKFDSKPGFKAKQKDLLDKLGQRIAKKSKSKINVEVIEEEIPGRTMENWT
jgi:hypothetical protein